MNKIVVDVYYIPGTKPTKRVIKFILDNKNLMNQYYFRLKNVTRNNYKNEAKKTGIKRAPAMLLGDKLYCGVEPIIEILSHGNKTAKPRARPISDEDRLNNFMLNEAMKPEDDDEEITEGMNMDEIRRKSTSMMSRKPHCDANGNPIPDEKLSRKARPARQRRKLIEDPDDDTEFLRRAGRDNIDTRGEAGELSAAPYPVEDGESILENYYAGIGTDVGF